MSQSSLSSWLNQCSVTTIWLLVRAYSSLLSHTTAVPVIREQDNVNIHSKKSSKHMPDSPSSLVVILREGSGSLVVIGVCSGAVGTTRVSISASVASASVSRAVLTVAHLLLVSSACLLSTIVATISSSGVGTSLTILSKRTLIAITATVTSYTWVGTY